MLYKRKYCHDTKIAPAKTGPFIILLSLPPDDFTESLWVGKGRLCLLSALTFSLRQTKTGPFIILVWLTPDDFTRQVRTSGWEMVKQSLPLVPELINLGLQKIVVKCIWHLHYYYARAFPLYFLIKIFNDWLRPGLKRQWLYI